MIKIYNISKGKEVAHSGIWADNFFTRLRGLLGKKQFPPGEALLIKPCKSVHCIGMKIPIDVVFVSADNQVVCIIENMKPYRLSPYIRNASYVIELPVGQAAAAEVSVGDILSLSSSK